MPESFSDRQATYAAWRDRLRANDDVIELATAPVVETPGEDWSSEALFRSTTVERADTAVD